LKTAIDFFRNTNSKAFSVQGIWASGYPGFG